MITMEKVHTDTKRKIVILTVTERCNLDCVYCYETAKTRNVMSLEVAKSAIEYEFNNSDEFDEIEFDLFGGEPTLRKGFIMDLVEWAYSKKFGKPFLFFLVTNGTLVHGEFQDWLLKYKNHVYVGLSLDGTPETHNKNRSNSYSKIDIAFFVKNYPEQGVRMTINSATVGNLSNDIIWLHRLGFREVTPVFASGIDWNVDKVRTELARELAKLCDFYFANPGIKPCSLFDIHLPNFLQERKKIQKWCGTGTSMVSIAVDGKKYPCQTFQPNTTAKPIEFGDIAFGKIDDFSDPECSNCILEPACPNCYGMNHARGGDLIKRDRQLCTLTKIRALAVSNLRARQIEGSLANLSEMNPAEIYQTIKAIQMMQIECSVD